MKSVYKYPLLLVPGRQVVELAAGIPVHFAAQDDRPYLWAIVSRMGIPTRRYFVIVGTGHDVHEEWRYVGTCMDRQFVWHLFECPAP